MAVVQANNLLEDQSQLESGPLSLLESGPYGTFVGIYDGHGGPETSRFICGNLFQHLKGRRGLNILNLINASFQKLDLLHALVLESLRVFQVADTIK